MSKNFKSISLLQGKKAKEPRNKTETIRLHDQQRKYYGQHCQTVKFSKQELRPTKQEI